MVLKEIGVISAVRTSEQELSVGQRIPVLYIHPLNCTVGRVQQGWNEAV
jgi:hypothetical protein